VWINGIRVVNKNKLINLKKLPGKVLRSFHA